MGNGTHQAKRLDESKSFVCLAFGCASGTVRVPKGTKEGTLIKHGCGGVGILSSDGRSWCLKPVDDPAPEDILEAPDTREEQELMEQQTVATEGAEAPKKKRGRPKKSAGVDPAVAVDQNEEILAEQAERDSNLLRNVEADCPHEIGTAEFLSWCEVEFDRRKQLLEGEVIQNKLAKVLKKDQAARKAAAVVITPELDKEFVKAAQQSDRRIDKAFSRGSESFFEAVKELIESGEKGYYKALGFRSFDSYRETKTTYCRSYIADGMKAYKALHGKIPDDKLMTIPIPSAVLLTRIPESKLTDEVIDAASKMKIYDFKEQEFPKHASQLADGTTGEAQPIQPEEFTWITRMRVHQQVADRWKKLLEIARWKAAGLEDEHDVYRNFTLDEKALLAIYIECAKASNWEAEYEEHKAIQASQAQDGPAF